MIYATLDMTTRRSLLEKGLPLHYYLEILTHQSAAVRELSKDTLQIINTVNCPIDSYGAINLPDDFVDDIGVGIPIGQDISFLPKRDSINPLRLHDINNGQFVPYTDQSADDQTVWNPPFVGWGWYWNVDSYGEPTGRFFGAGGGVQSGYKVIRARRQIQLTEDFIGFGSVLLMYVSSGQTVDSASQIDFRAFRCIQTYSDWMRSPNASIKDSLEANTFYNERRLLRAAINDTTTTDIKNIIHKAYKAAPKT